MAFDLQLTEKGDILFYENDYSKQPFKLSFLPNKGIKVSFGIQNSIPRSATDSCFKLSFEVKDLKYNKEVIGIDGNNNIVQAIQIRLKTPLGDIIDNTNLGSKLELAKHKNISDPKVLSLIQSYVTSAISDIITNPQVLVEATVVNTTNYNQGVNIYIYNNGSLLYSTQIKG